MTWFKKPNKIIFLLKNTSQTPKNHKYNNSNKKLLFLDV